MSSHAPLLSDLSGYGFSSDVFSVSLSPVDDMEYHGLRDAISVECVCKW